jgi:endonuclease/exonuclease/phosphatase family metal-dependent hydrolase
MIALQERWGTGTTSQAHEFAEHLAMYAGFVEPALPPRPKPGSQDQAGLTMGREQAGVAVGIGLLSRWPLDHVHAVALPARHRNPAPVALIAQVRHPLGPLHVVAACLEWEPAYNDDRIAQARVLTDLATDPSTDGPLPVICCGGLNAAPDSPVLRHPARHMGDRRR